MKKIYLLVVLTFLFSSFSLFSDTLKFTIDGSGYKVKVSVNNIDSYAGGGSTYYIRDLDNNRTYSRSVSSDSWVWKYKVELTGNHSKGEYFYKVSKKVMWWWEHQKTHKYYYYRDNVVPNITHTSSNDIFNESGYHPYVTFSDPSGSATYDRASGVSSFQYSVPGSSTYANYTSSDYFTESGYYTFRAIDRVGNSRTMNLFVDLTAPVIDEIVQNTDSMTNEDVVLTVSGHDDAGGSGIANYQYSFDQSLWTNGANVIIPENRIVYFRAVDNHGNISPIANHSVSNIDKTDPVLNISAAPSDALSGRWLSEIPVVLDISVADNDLISAKEVYVNDVEQSPWEGNSISVELTDEAEHAVRFYVEDRAGNIVERSEVVRIDTSAPELLLGIVTDGVQSGSWSGAEEVILSFNTDFMSGSADLDSDSARFQLDGGPWLTNDGDGNYIDWAAEEVHISRSGISNVRVRITDEAGLTGYSNSVQLKLDHTGPEFDILSDEYAINVGASHILNFDTLNLIDGQSGALSRLIYKVDDGYEVENHELMVSPIPSLEEGDHYIDLFAFDTVGNQSTVRIPFKVDKTAPANLVPFVFDGGNNPVSSGGYLISDSMTITFNASDVYGSVDSFEYYLSDSYIEYPDSQILGPELTSTLTNTISGFAEGPNYFYYRPVDKAGNRGAFSEFVVRYDTGAPGMPLIESSTHPYAANTETAVPVDDASFSIIPRVGTSISGIDHFTYVLRKGDSEVESGNLSGDSILTLYFSNLEDNDQGELYSLSVRAVGLNGISSLERIYQFRVDTSPPENLTLYIQPQNDAVRYFKDLTARIRWAVPIDMTGVSSYYLLLSDTDRNIFGPSDINEEIINESIQIDSGENEQTLNLSPYLPENFGTIFVYLIAEDFAGNRELAVESFNIDAVHPVIAETPVFSISYENLDRRSLTIDWNDASDNSGVTPVYSLKIYRFDEAMGSLFDISSWLNLDESEYIFDGIDLETQYLVQLKVIDHAGNEALYSHSFSSDPEAVIVDIPMPFAYDVAGFHIEGIRTVAGDDSGYLIVPQSMNAGDQPLELEQIDFAGNDFVSASLDADFETGFHFKGFDFAGRGISLSDLGLNFSSVTFSNDETDYAFDNFTITFAPYEEFIDSFVTTLDEPVSLEVGEGWQLDQVLSSKFAGAGWRLYDSHLNTDNLTEYSGNLFSEIIVPELTLEADGSFVHVQTAPFTINMGTSVFNVEEALLYPDRIVITKAEMQVPDTAVPVPVYIGNFSIDTSGQLEKLSNFFFDSFSFSDQYGNEYTIDSVEIVGAAITASGIITTAGGDELRFDGMNVNGDGIDWNLPPALSDEQSFNVNGYNITSDSVYFTEDGYFINSGRLTLPLYWGGGELNIYNLGLDRDKSTVNTEGTINDPLTLTNLQYADEIIFEGFLMREQGLFGRDIIVPIPAGMSNPVRDSLVFQNMEIRADGTLGEAECDLVSSDGYIFSSFTVDSASLTFDGEYISSDFIGIELPASFGSGTARFSGYVLSETEIASIGQADEPVNYLWGDEVYTLIDPQLTVERMEASAYFDLPGTWEAAILRLDNLYFKGNGETNSSDVTGTGYALIGGWRTVLEDPEFLVDGIGFGKASVALYDIMGGGTIRFFNAEFLDNGGFVSPVTGDEEYVFESVEGFQVTAASCALTINGIDVKGKVTLPDYLGTESGSSVIIEETDSLLIKGDGSLVSNANEETVPLRQGRIKISGTGFTFGNNGVNVASGIVTSVPLGDYDVPVNLPLSSVDYYGSGEVRRSEVNYQAHQFPVFPMLDLEVRNVHLTYAGLEMTGELGFEPLLGNEMLYFDSLIFTGDGKLYSDSYIDYFDVRPFGTHWELYGTRLTNDYLDVGALVITLPEELESNVLQFRDINVSFDGEFSIGSIDTPPLPFLGMDFYLTKVSYIDSIFDFGGKIVLPDTLPGQLKSLPILINTFSIDMENKRIHALNAGLGRTLKFNPMDSDWTFALDTIGLNYVYGQDLWLEVEKAELLFPDSLNFVETAYVSGMRLSLETGDFEFDEAGITGFNKEFFGVDFYFDNISIAPDDNDFKISLSGSATLPSESDNLPDLFKGLTVELERFEFYSDGTLGEFYGGISGLQGDVFKDKLSISDGTVIIGKVDGDFLIELEGDFKFSDDFPDGVAGLTTGGSLKYNITQNKVISFNAYVADINIDDLFGNVQVQDGSIGISMDEGDETFEATLEGLIVLPETESMPEFLRGSTIEIGSFVMDGTGSLIDLDIEYEHLEKAQFVDSMYMENTRIQILYDSDADKLYFDVGTTITLEDPVPEEFRLTFDLRQFRMDSAGNVLAFDASAIVPDQPLFNTLDMRGCELGLNFQESDGWLISVTGELGMPDSLPGDLGDMFIDIDKFTFRPDGEIVELNIGAASINTELFSGLELSNGSIYITKRTDDMLFSLGGSIILPESVKTSLNGLESLDIIRADFSSVSGLEKFEAGVSGQISFELFAGIDITFEDIEVTEDDFFLAGNLTFPDDGSLPDGLGGLTVNLNAFRMSWEGEITEISSGIEYIDVDFEGFTIALENLEVSKDRFGVETANITLPANLGNQTIPLKNVYYDYGGKFHMELGVPSIQQDVAGFTLMLENPDFNLDEGYIAFERTYLKTPDVVGNFELTLNNVKISSTGLMLSGGGFQLPNFKLQGGMEFSLHANFSVDSSTGNYFIEAGGKVFMPGMGTLEVLASFINKDPEYYPIGMKRAYFSYTVSGLGLPLGSTGLYLNQIRGGIAFGPPDEIPVDYRPFFPDDGTRMQLGLSVIDASNGKLIRGGVDFWIDVENWSAALEGRVAVMNGFFYSEVGAAIGQDIFYGKVYVQLKFVEGKAEIWIWKDGRYTKMSGRSWARFGLPRGSIIDKKIKILWKKIHIVFPKSTFWLAKINAEFGQFTNGQTGLKGYVNVPILGNVGVYVAKNVFKLGNVSSYKLYIPTEHLSVSGPMMFRSSSMYVLPETDSRVFYQDSTDLKQVDALYFDVPGPGQVQSNISRSATMMRMSSTELIDVETQVERIIFALGYSDGSPTLTAISPSGRTYDETSGEVEVMYDEDLMMLTVFNPEAGQWNVSVDGLEDGSEYSLEVIGKNRNASALISTPSYMKEPSTGAYRVEGELNAYAGEQPTMSLYLCEDRESKSGFPVFEDRAMNNGSFAIDLDLSGFDDGEYYILAKVDDGSGIPIETVSDGTIVLDRGQEMLDAVVDIIPTFIDGNTMHLNFTDPNGRRTGGYKIYLNDGQETKVFDAGLVQQMDLPVRETGTDFSITVKAYNSFGHEGKVSETIHYKHELLENNRDNLIVIDEDVIPVNLLIEHEEEVTIPYRVESLKQTGTALDYMSVTVLEGPSWMTPSYDYDNWSLDTDTGEVKLYLSAYSQTNDELDSSRPTPGNYDVTLRFYNSGDTSTYDDVTLNVDLSYPAPVIESVTPDSWHQDDETLVTIYGENFVSGVRFFLDGREIAAENITMYEASFRFMPGEVSGAHTIKALLPDGQEAAVEVTVIEPSYFVYVLKSHSLLQAGDSDQFYFNIEGMDRFTGSAHFDVEEGETGYVSADLLSDSIESGETGVLNVIVSPETPAGIYGVELISDQGDLVTFEITVTEAEILPEISNINPLWVFAGTEAQIIGGGFGEERGSVELNGKTLTVIEWNPNRISVSTDKDSVSGTVVVSRADGETAQAVMTIKGSGFELYNNEEAITIQPGEEKKILITVRGAAIPVDLTAEVENGLFLDNTIENITPNGQWLIEVYAPQDIETGQYSLTLNGESLYDTDSLELNIIVGEPFAIDSYFLPQGMVDDSYYYEIKHSHESGNVSYEIIEKSLPDGLSLSRSGVISGTPVVPGVFNFTVEATDDSGHRDQLQTYIDVEENVWSSVYKNGGRTGFIPISGPGEAVLQWNSDSENETESLVTGSKKLFVRTDSSIEARKTSTGSLVYEIVGQFIDYLYSDGKLYTLDNSGVFAVYDGQYGNLKWSRENVDAFALTGISSYLWTEGKLLKLSNLENDEIPGGILEATYIDSVPEDTDILLNDDERLFKISENKIYRFNDGWIEYYVHDNDIRNAAFRNGEFLILDSVGILSLLDGDGALTFLASDDSDQKLLFSDEAAVLYGNGLTYIDLQAGNIVFHEEGTFDKAGLTLDKLYVQTEGAIKAINKYRGNEIWRVLNDSNDFIISGGKVYSATANGTVEAYTGRININGPVLSYITEPETASGNNGYFINPVELTIDAVDHETKAETVEYRINGSEPVLYTGPVVLPEGEFSFTSAGTDTDGMRGYDTTRYFRVDHTPPVTSISIDPEPEFGAWFGEPVEVNLTATDNYSGVDEIQYNLDGDGWVEFAEPFKINVTGSHILEYRSLDAAGGVENTLTREIGLDLEDPSVSYDIERETAATLLYLEGFDPGSGIERIEYRIDNGAMKIYDSPIAFFENGSYMVVFRSVDKVGKTSLWTELDLEVRPLTKHDVFRDLRFTYWAPYREIVEKVQKTDAIFAPSNGSNNRLKNLPDYLVGSFYVRLHRADSHTEGKIFSFTSGADMTLYRFEDPDSGVDLSDWELMDEGYEISRYYFRNGADIYRRKVNKGDFISICGSDSHRTSAPLIFAITGEEDDLILTSPRNGEELHPYDEQMLSLSWNKASDEAVYSWSYSIDGNEAIALDGNGRIENFTVPYTADHATLSLMADAVEPGRLDSFRKDFVVFNKSGIEVYSPVNGEEILVGDSVIPDYSVKSFDGTEIDVPIDWSIPIGDDGAFRFTEPGSYRLTGSAEIGHGIVLTCERLINVVEQYEPLKLDIGENYMGDSYGLQETGKEFGFSEDMSESLETVTIIRFNFRRGPDFLTDIIAPIPEKGDFSLATADGIYRVDLKLINPPVICRPWIGIEDETLSLRRWQYGIGVLAVSTTVEVTDGKLTITGSDNLEILEIGVSRVDDTAETEIGFIENLFVLPNRHKKKFTDRNEHR